MFRIKNLLVATDFSARAARAEKRAAMLCAASRCDRLDVLTVREPEQLEVLVRVMSNSVAAAKDILDDEALLEMRARTGDLSREFEIEPAFAVRFGQPAIEIAARSEEVLADLIVIGAHGRNFFADLFLGNTADKLIRRCKLPLLIVKNEPVFAYRNILVPVDFSEDSRQAAQLALAIEPPASITFLHVYDVWYASKMSYAGVSKKRIDQYSIKSGQDALLALTQFVDEINDGRRYVTCNVAPGHPSANVRDYAEKMQADLIIIGKHGRSRIEELIVGSVTRDTIDWTKCDIMVVPPRAQ